VKPAKRRGGQINMRGVGETKTVIMLDDSILNDSFHQNVFWNLIPIDAIERVEVIPGPFSALYGGRGGIGGTIRFITKMPEKEEFFVKGVYGSDNMKRGTISYGNKFGKLSLYINYDYMRTDGYVSDYITKSTQDGSGDIPVTGWEKTTDSKGSPMYLIGDKGKNKSWEWNILSKLRLDFSDTSRVTLTFSPSEWNYGGWAAGLDTPNSYLKNANTGAPVSSGKITFNDDGVQKYIDLGTATFLGGKTEKSKRYRYNLAYETQFTPDISLKATVEYVDEKGRGGNTSAREGATPSGGPGKLARFPFDRWQGRLESKALDIFGFNNLTLGADYMKEKGGRENYNEMTDWTDVNNTVGGITAKSWGVNNVYSLFAQDETILMKKRLKLYLGGRLDYWKISDLMDWTKIHNIGTHTYKDRHETYFSPKGSVKYSPFESTTLRLSLAKAFTAPRLHDILGGYSKNPNSMRLSSPYLKPEKATCWEAGVDQTIADTTLVRATYFENYLHDYKYTEKWVEAGINYDVAKTGGKARIRGVELGIKHQITPFISAYANMTYQDSEVTEDKQNPQKVGKRLTGVPQEMYKFGLLCEKYAGLSGSVTGRYVGKVYGDPLNRDTTNHVYGSYDPYFTMDAKISYEIKKGLEISFAVDNLFNKDYYLGSRAPGREFFGEISCKL
jgi:iron complex outermembrane receptor protein